MTQRALADKSGITPSYLSHIENGNREPTASLLGRIAAALDTVPSVLYLLALTEEDVPVAKRAAYERLAPALSGFLNEILDDNNHLATQD